MENTENKSFTCAKCGNSEFTSDKIATTSGMLTKIFDVQNKKFTAVSCTKCGYTELYKTSTSGLENAADFLLGR